MYFSPFPLKEQKNILNCFETMTGIQLVELLISAAQSGKKGPFSSLYASKATVSMACTVERFLCLSDLAN